MLKTGLIAAVEELCLLEPELNLDIFFFFFLLSDIYCSYKLSKRFVFLFIFSV